MARTTSLIWHTYTCHLLTPGVYTLEELKELGKGKGWCPYFLARHVIAFANVVVYNYQYLLDPKISQLISSRMQRECVGVFDEAHNIDNICIEVMSINFRLPTLEACGRNLSRVSSEIDKLKAASQTSPPRRWHAAAELPSH